jgi:hypothetical protein
MHTRRITPLLFLALAAFGQDMKPNFTGTRRFMSVKPGNGLSSGMEERIEQTDSTIAISTIEDKTIVLYRVVYPTDGQEIKTQHGRLTETNTGHWEGTRLILESTGTFKWGVGKNHGPHTTRFVLSLSDDGKIMEHIHHVGGDSRHDVESIAERVVE